MSNSKSTPLPRKPEARNGWVRKCDLPRAKRNPVPGDYVDRMKKLYRESGNLRPTNTQSGWVPA